MWLSEQNMISAILRNLPQTGAKERKRHPHRGDLKSLLSYLEAPPVQGCTLQAAQDKLPTFPKLRERALMKHDFFSIVHNNDYHSFDAQLNNYCLVLQAQW